MKKLFVICLGLLLVGCGAVDTASRSTSCMLAYENVSDEVMTASYVRYMESEGDFVSIMIMENTFELYGDAQSYRDAEEAYAMQFVEIDGIDYEYELDGSTVVERTIINLDVVDIQTLINLGLLAANNDDTPIYISYSSSIQELEDSGYTCEVEIKE